MQDDRHLVNLQQPASSNYFLVPDRSWEVEQPPQPIHFHGMVRGVSRFGLLLCGGLCLTLLARLIPAFQPAYALCLVVGTGVCVLRASLSRSTQTRMNTLIIGLLVVAGVVGGSWDAIYAVMSEPTGQQTGVQILVVGIALGMAIGAERMLSRSRD